MTMTTATNAAATATPTVSPDTLAIEGGAAVRTRKFPEWPIVTAGDETALIAVLRSKKWGARLGNRVDTFAGEFARYQEAAHGIALTNGTAALEVALRAVGVEPFDEVILPPYTFVASATAILSIGAIPVFCDIREDTLLIDAEDAARRITPRTKAILPVHLAGQPADMDAVMEVAKRHDLKIVEDAAQAHGASWKGAKVGALGDAGTFSFQSSKNLTAGEGGIVVTNDRAVAELAWSYVNVGRVPDGAWYQHEVMGWNLRMTEFQAAILLSQFERLPAQFETRERNARLLDDELAKIDGIHPQVRDERITGHAHHLYSFRYDPAAWGGKPRTWFLKALRAEGIPASDGYTTPLYRMNAVRNERQKWAAIARRAGVDVTIPETPDAEGALLPVTERVCAEQGAWLGQSLLLGEEADTMDVVTAFAKLRRAV